MRHRPTRHACRILAATALAWGLALSGAPAVAQAPGAAQATTVSGVTVKVTARNTAADALTWEFGVVLDTHSQELSDDLTKSAVLRTDDGRELVPTAWKGAAAGGHHREGTLEFAAPTPRPRSVELRIQRPGEPQPRSFRWSIS
jgi:hypothetical protein